jgi:hypothetical protein
MKLIEDKQALLFLKKKKQKNFCPGPRWRHAPAAKEQKFFGYFFSKK